MCVCTSRVDKPVRERRPINNYHNENDNVGVCVCTACYLPIYKPSPTLLNLTLDRGGCRVLGWGVCV